MDEGEDFGVLTINKSFAENYDRYRQKEELQKLKDKYGDVSDEESSSSETEDEDAEALTDQLEKDWLRAYAAVKSRDPKIYKKDVKFYQSAEDSTNDETSQSRKKQMKPAKQKPVTLKDYERKVILEKGGVLSDEENVDYEERDPSDLGYYEEQDEIKKSFKIALDSDDSDTELLTHRPKTEQEEAKEEDDYRDWLKGQKPDPEDSEKYGQELVPLKKYWTDPKLEEGEKFLRDYILNKGYLEKDKDRIPTYNEIVDEAGFSSEEEILKKQEEFETKYNFRYEEPDQDFIKHYPRTIPESVRREDNKRAKSRADVKDRKYMEKQKKREELKQLKNLKKREILDKMERLKEITGNPSLAFNQEDLEGDFDPEKYDKLMGKVFDDEYYGDGGGTKPVFSDDEEIGLEDDWDNWQGRDDSQDYNDTDTYEGYEDCPHVDDPDFNMDADYDPTAERPKKEGKKQKKKSKFSQAVYQSKPVFDPTEKSFETYFDEYYRLDYEDIIGDLPCRFKYRKTVPNNYGLTTGEILSAEDRELNSWCSVKKMSQYKGDQEEYVDLKKYRKKAKKKYNVLTSLKKMQDKVSAGKSSDNSGNSNEISDDKSSKKRKIKQRIETVTSDSSMAEITTSDNAGELSESTALSDSGQSSPRKKQKKEAGLGKKEENSQDKNLSQQDMCESQDEANIDSEIHRDNLSKQKKWKRDEHKKKKTALPQINRTYEKNVDIESKGNIDGLPKKTKSGDSKDIQQNVKFDSKNKKKRKKKKHKPIITVDRLKAYGINPKKFKQQMKKSKTS